MLAINKSSLCLREGMAADQWPSTADSRAAAAQYVVNDLGIDPLNPSFLGALCVGKVPMRVANGMITLGNRAVLDLTFPAALLEPADIRKVLRQHEPANLDEARLVRFVLHCIALRLDVPVAASFVRAQHLARPASTLCLKLWKECAFLHVSPEPVAEAMLCGRPDLIELVQRFYGEWLRACRSPAAISDALAFLVASTWRLESTSTSLGMVVDIMNTAQIAARPVVPCNPDACDIVVDNRSGVLVARRDKALMALLLVCGPSAGHFKDHVSVFAEVREEFPDAFSERAEGSSALDELPIRSG